MYKRQVVETIGGTTLAREVISAALKAVKSVVTANKDLLALYGGELLAIAAEKQTDLFFEAAVAGGIPVVQAVKEGLAGNRFKSIMGIVNGTTNFILTKMSETGEDFADALAEAQLLGYAEADPTSDIEGYDAARKVAILSSMAFNSRVKMCIRDRYGDIYTQIPLRSNLQIAVEDYEGQKGTVIIANPNAPTGLALPLSDIRLSLIHI